MDSLSTKQIDDLAFGAHRRSTTPNADATAELRETNRALQRRIGLLTAERDRAEATVRQQSRELAETMREVERLRDLVDRVPEYRPAPDPRSPLTGGAR